jgi:hypothetical protein
MDLGNMLSSERKPVMLVDRIEWLVALYARETDWMISFAAVFASCLIDYPISRDLTSPSSYWVSTVFGASLSTSWSARRRALQKSQPTR